MTVSGEYRRKRGGVLWVVELRAGGVGESHDLGAPEFFVLMVLGVERGSLALERVGDGWGGGSVEVVDGAGEMGVRVETERRGGGHLVVGEAREEKKMKKTDEDFCLDVESIEVSAVGMVLDIEGADVCPERL